MHRLFRLSFLVVLLGMLAITAGNAAKPTVYVSGRVDASDVRVFVKDSSYYVNNEYIIDGTLIIEPGTDIYFHPNGRMVIARGGRVLADGDAKTTYNSRPGGIDPLGTPYSSSNPKGFAGYADFRYFLYNYQPSGNTGPTTITVNTLRDVTVNRDKYNYIYNIVIDTSIIDPLSADTTYKNRHRRLQNLIIGQEPIPDNPEVVGVSNPEPVSGKIIVPFEYALMFVTSRLQSDPDNDVNLNIRPWRRIGDKAPDVADQTIRFIGQPVDNFSHEWGHIIVLPGARAAFFRHCRFEGFHKDTTVDRIPLYTQNMTGAISKEALNNKFRMLTNGGGGAITTFSSRTWLLNSEFTQNYARYRGGALQILQTPTGFPTFATDASLNNPANNPDGQYYNSGKNPNITDRDGNISHIITRNPLLQIDRIDEPNGALTGEYLNDYERQAYDDGRLAMYLGRMRNLTFSINKVQLSNFGRIRVGNVWMTTDILDEPANYPVEYGNHAYGGAVYISGSGEANANEIEVAFGINNSIRVNGAVTQFNKPDQFVCAGNEANNYQNNVLSKGARGGGIYIGKYTSLIVAGQFTDNETYTKYFQEGDVNPTIAKYSMGGAIYEEETFGRLQVRGGPERNTVFQNPTEFMNNTAGAGGAIYVDGNMTAGKYSTLPVPFMYHSPVVGGSDVTPTTRDYGFHIKFAQNTALAYGGAVYTNRNMLVWGAGGVEAFKTIGYDGEYAVAFDMNKAAYGGGAVYIGIPESQSILLTSDRRSVRMARTIFDANEVGYSAPNSLRTSIKGGAALYASNTDLNVMKAVQFLNNKLKNGNGAAIAMIHPDSTIKRFFITDLDEVIYHTKATDPTRITTAISYDSFNKCFTFDTTAPYFVPETGMLTRFIKNEIETDQDMVDSLSGSGTTQIGQGTENPTEDLYSTVWLNNTTGFGVGKNGYVIKYTNGGTTWDFKQIADVDFNAVYFTNGTFGYVAGDDGQAFRTVNGGTSWTPMSSMTSENINDMRFIGSNLGFAVGDNGAIIKTTDGGAIWMPVNSMTNVNLNSVYFTSSSAGFAAGDLSTILRTTDGGASWGVQNVPGMRNNLNKIFFTNSQTGIIIGDGGMILKTVNGGNTWVEITSGTTDDLQSMYFTNQNNGYLVGLNGTAMNTTDAGDTWTAFAPTPSKDYYDIYFPSNNYGYIVGAEGLVLQTTDAGATWNEKRPADERVVDVKRYHPGTMLPENGIGLGGAMFILDKITTDRVGREDSLYFNRVRMQNNFAFTGAAVYSDNFDLKLIFNRSLITGNTVDNKNTVGLNQNAITGPYLFDGTDAFNQASKDLTGSIIYGEIQGPLPSAIFSEGANSIYGNHARFLIRLPDAPNTKGVLAGITGIGFGGTDTLRGNYWGATEANVNMLITNPHGIPGLSDNVVQETFYVEQSDSTYMKFMYQASADPREQGPFESIEKFNYTPVPLKNDANDENKMDQMSIPEKYLMSGHIYDLYDKGTDIKTADYTKRRMSPIEDFAVGIPPYVRRYNVAAAPSYGKYVRRWVRDPFIADSMIGGNYVYPFVHDLQTEYHPDKNGKFYQPIGQPLYLETSIDYSGLASKSNHDPLTPNESVFFVVNENTGDYIRVNLKQVSEDAPYREVFRARVELVPDITNRGNTLLRRTNEGLLNLGTADFLLRNIYRDPYNEDKGTLPGRRYSSLTANFGNATNLFRNRPQMPLSNSGNVTYYGGERFKALPVNVGDTVSVVSRTVLWRDGVIPAFKEGIKFGISRSTEPSQFTGNIVDLQDTARMIRENVPSDYPWKNRDTVIYTEFLNKVFLTEDRDYPQAKGTYSDLPVEWGQGRDSILSVTAVDSNNYYDPRYLMDSLGYAKLTYRWFADINSGISRWLLCDSVTSGYREDYQANPLQNPRDKALGYFILRGRPMNPFVVPGGEYVTVQVDNYPTHWRMLDSMLAHNARMRALGLPEIPQDTIDKFISLFTNYMHAPLYDITNARYLQQDTIDYGSNFTNTYTFKIFVVDSIPAFIDPATAEEAVTRRLDWNNTLVDTLVVYKPTVYTCGQLDFGNNQMRLIANLTDKLRFQADFNTDDENEDEWADKNYYARQRIQSGGRPWDFRFGKTAYGYMNKAIRFGDTKTADTTVIDTTTYDQDMDGIKDDKVITQERPNWMANEYHYRYGSETINDKDIMLVDLTTSGQINIRIDSSDAFKLLTPVNQINKDYNTHALFTIVANDGHAGVNAQTMKVYINVKPTIVTTTLPPAKEDIDYNPELLDTNKRIAVFDPNMDQGHTFELIYPGYGQNLIPKDPCYPEAGNWDVTTMKTTPNWLKINKESGLLYGTPRVKDAPDNAKITVLVTDEGGLTEVKQFDMTVEETNHLPHLINPPTTKCVEKGKSYVDTIYVRDMDLLRGNKQGDKTEHLTIKVNKPSSNISVSPSDTTGIFAGQAVNGKFNEKDYTFKVVVRSNNFDPPLDKDGKATIEVQVTDAAGEIYIISYKVQISEATDFTCPILIENNLGAEQILEFGTGSRATAGDGLDNEENGKLDSNYCEYELPPLPPVDVFDARWTINTRQGIARNIFRTGRVGDPQERRYVGKLQPGGENGQTSPAYPITLTWKMSDVPLITNTTTNPSGATWWIRDALSNGSYFSVNMNTGQGNHNDKVDLDNTLPNNSCMLRIKTNVIESFVIVHDWISPVNEQPTGMPNEYSIVKASPNPTSSTTEITIGLPQTNYVNIHVIDNLGNIVTTISSHARFDAGYATILWNGENVASGAYTLRMVAGNTTSVYPIVIVK